MSLCQPYAARRWRHRVEQIGVEAVVLKEHLGEAVAVTVEAHEGVAVGEGRSPGRP